MADPYREIVEGPVHRLAVRARASFAVRVGLPLLTLIYSGGFCVPICVGAAANDGGWSSAAIAGAVTLTFLGLFVCASFLVSLVLGRNAWTSQVLELDRDRQVLRFKAGRRATSIPFADIRGVHAFDGCLRVETAEKVHEPIDVYHRRSKREAEQIAARIQELVVAETGEMIPRVRIQDGQRIEADAAFEAAAEREAEIARNRRS